MKLQQSTTVAGSGGYIPHQVYGVRVVGTEFGQSGSGNPMTTLSCEIIRPETFEHNGSHVACAGQQFKLYLVHNGQLVGKQTVSSQAQVYELMDKLGLNEMMEFNQADGYVYDTDLHKEYFLGMEFDMELRSEEQIKRKERQPGQKVGDPILDGEGKQISAGHRIQANISDVLPKGQNRAMRNKSVKF